MRAVLESAGVSDVIAKSKGSSNAHNLVKATVLALSQIRDSYQVAGDRGISMNKVFNLSFFKSVPIITTLLPNASSLPVIS